MRYGRVIIIWAAALFAAAVVAGVLYLTMSPERARAAIGGPFRLTSQTGEIIDSESLKGRPYAIFFGFTYCPEICPTTMMDMAHLIDKLGAEAKDFKVYFVSVDPERDTPEALGRYLSAFGPHMVGLTGSADEIAQVAREFRVYYKKVPIGDGNYTIDHSAFVYLMGADGRFVNVLQYQEPDDKALAKLKKLFE